MNASGVKVAGEVGLRRRGTQGADVVPDEPARGTIAPTKPAPMLFAPLVDAVWYVWTYLCAVFGLILVEPAEFVAMRECTGLTQ